MARISELHYSNAYARNSGVNEFLEVALGSGDSAADFVVSFYQADGTVGIEIPLTHPNIQVSTDPDNGETVYVISADDFPILLTDPDGGGSGNYEAYALTNTDTSTVVDFYDIGGGTQNILALDGAAAGAVSDNLPVLVGPNSTTTTLQFNQPNPNTLSYGTVAPGDTGIACFVAGTRIQTTCGLRQIQTLREGDLVVTKDSGPMPIRWIGRRTVPGYGAFAPVRFSRDVLGSRRTHYVSQNHRVLLRGWQAEMLFGQDEVLVPAKALVNDDTVRVVHMPEVTYFHMLFDKHEIVRGDGIWSESFYPGVEGLKGMEEDTRDELLALFPELRGKYACYGPAARMVCPHSVSAAINVA